MLGFFLRVKPDQGDHAVNPDAAHPVNRQNRQGVPFSTAKPQIVRDSKIAGFHLWVGKLTKTYRFQYETPRINSQCGSTMVEWLGEHPHASADEARAKALEIVALRARGGAQCGRAQHSKEANQAGSLCINGPLMTSEPHKYPSFSGLS